MQDLYQPRADFPGLARMLFKAENNAKNLSPWSFKPPASFTINGEEWHTGVACADIGDALYNMTLQEALSHLKELERQSYISQMVRLVICLSAQDGP